MKYRVSPSQFLAVQNARVAAAQDASLDAHQIALVLEALDRLLASVRARAAHIGQVNQWLAHLIEEGHAGLLPEAEVDKLSGLLAQGGLLAFDDTGFAGGLW